MYDVCFTICFYSTIKIYTLGLINIKNKLFRLLKNVLSFFLPSLFSKLHQKMSVCVVCGIRSSCKRQSCASFAHSVAKWTLQRRLITISVSICNKCMFVILCKQRMIRKITYFREVFNFTKIHNSLN